MRPEFHVPVLAGPVLEFLNPRPGQTILDGTVGGGGHSALIAERIGPEGRLVAVDQDPEALQAASGLLRHLSPKIELIHGNFRRIPEILDSLGIELVDGILLDLGVSSHQLDAAERGFSFRADTPLDMRMDATSGEPASDLLARLEHAEIRRILWELGEERWADRIAAFLVERRRNEPIRTTGQLAEIVKAAIPRKAWPPDKHPATRTFQALRIAVNDELGALDDALERGVQRLRIGGRMVVISYHSLEDRRVKRAFQRLSGRCQCPPGLPVCRCGARALLKVLTKKPVTPDAEEIRRNPRSRSARLRAAERSSL